MGGGTPSQVWTGVTHPMSRREEGCPILLMGGGYPIQDQDGGTPGYPPVSRMGYSPSRPGMVVPLVSRMGYPPGPDLEWGGGGTPPSMN